MLPGLDGLSVLAELRERDREMPVIILSARAEEYDKVTGLGVGADDYMTKPFSLAELVARINAALRRKRQAEANGRWLRFAAIAIDSVSRRVLLEGKEVALTAREFDLLVHLASHPGRAHRREELLHAVWGYQYEGTVRTVDNFMRSLRAKLEADPSAPRHLITVHGVGYRFEP
jgi:DNA-binding response OmpR family regulator